MIGPEWISSLYDEKMESKWGVNLPKMRDCAQEKSFDIYSFGHILWAIWKEEEPLLNASEVTIISNACNGLNAVLPDAEGAPTPWKRLFDGCWAPIESRFNIDQVIDQIQLLFTFVDGGSDALSSSEKLVVNRQVRNRTLSIGDRERPESKKEKSSLSVSTATPIWKVPKSPQQKSPRQKLQKKEPLSEPVAMRRESISEAQSIDYVHRIASLEASLRSCQLENLRLQRSSKLKQKELEKQAQDIVTACEQSLSSFRDAVSKSLSTDRPSD